MRRDVTATLSVILTVFLTAPNRASSAQLPRSSAMVAHPEPMLATQARQISLQKSHVELDLYPSLWRARFQLSLEGPADNQPWHLGSPAEGPAVESVIRRADPRLLELVGVFEEEAAPPAPPRQATLASLDPDRYPDLVTQVAERIPGWWGVDWVDSRVIVNGRAALVEHRRYRTQDPRPPVPVDWWTMDVTPDEDGHAELELELVQPLTRWVRTDSSPDSSPWAARYTTCHGESDASGPWNRMDTILLLEHADAFANVPPVVDLILRPHGPPGTVLCTDHPAQPRADGALTLSLQPGPEDWALDVSLWVPTATTDGATPREADYPLDGLPPVWAFHDWVARFARSSEASGIGVDASRDFAYRSDATWLTFVDELHRVVDEHPDGSTQRYAAHILWELATGCMTSYTEVGDDRVYHNGTGCVPWLTAGVPNDVSPREPAGPEPTLDNFALGMIETDGGSLVLGASAFGDGHRGPMESVFARYRYRQMQRRAMAGGLALLSLLGAALAWRRRRRPASTASTDSTWMRPVSGNTRGSRR